MQNLSAAREVCLASGVSEDDFMKQLKVLKEHQEDFRNL